MDMPIIKIQNFDGPFDLLLHLIKKNKMSINDIKIYDITKQYLDYIKLMKELDLEVTSEFVVIAATLIEIKSKSLLPKLKVEDDEKSEDKTEKTSVSAKLTPIEQDGKWGFTDEYSNIKVECKYEKVTEFNKNGFAGVKLDGKWGSINEKGEVVIEPIYNLDNFYEIDFIGKYYKVVYDYKTVYYSDDI